MKAIRSLKAKINSWNDLHSSASHSQIVLQSSTGPSDTAADDDPAGPSKPSITDILPTEIMQQIIEEVRQINVAVPSSL